MKITKESIKKTGKFIVYGAIINQLLLPFCQTMASNLIGITENKRELKTEEIVDLREIRRKFGNLGIDSYLQMANNYSRKNKKDGEDCKYSSNSTFDYFQEIVEKDGRKDLFDKIRLCSGLNSKAGHMWIEYNRDVEWIPYEAVNGISGKINLNFDKEKDCQSIPGTKVFYPTLNSLKGDGILGFFAQTYNTFLEEIIK